MAIGSAPVNTMTYIYTLFKSNGILLPVICNPNKAILNIYRVILHD